MTYFDDYKKRLQSQGETFKEQLLNAQKESISSVFALSPSYFQVGVNNSPSLIDAQIVDDSNVRDQKLITTIDYHLKNGDIIDWQGSKWINILTDNMSDIYYRGTLRRVIGQLKWVGQNGLIKEYHFTFKSDPASNFGVVDGRIMSMGNERRNLIVPLNENTREIAKDKRFIFDGRAWRVTAVDRISVDGLFILTVDEDDIDSALDNLELEIADYYNNLPHIPPQEPAPIGYSLTIGGSDIIKKGMSQTYKVSVYADGVLDNSKSVEWELYADDENLASITNRTNSECTIKAGSTIGQNIELKAVLSDDENVFVYKQIQIKGLY